MKIMRLIARCAVVFILLFIFSGCCALCNFNVNGFIATSQPDVLDDVWIHPELLGENSSINLFPFYVSSSEHAPYRAGIFAVARDNKFLQLELMDLTLQQEGRELIVVQNDKPVITSFPKNDPKFSSVARKAECLVDIGDWPNLSKNTPIHMTAVYTIHTLEEPITKTFEASMEPSIIKGLSWFEPIHD